jgi:hypothetical protein
MARASLRSTLLLLPLLGACVPIGSGGPAAAPAPLPRAERSGFLETTRYAEVLEFMAAVSQRAPEIHLTTFGYSLEGRALPLAVWGAPAATPEAVRGTGKTRVYLQGNIHAGEVEGKEAMLRLLRELALGEHRAWADSLVLLVGPIYNADGNERISLLNRPRQHGPLAGMGQRANAQGLDLNRDHMKLDAPESHALTRLLELYDPHVVVDLHATNGTYHAYHLTYSHPLHPGTDTGVVDVLRNGLLPAVTERLRAERGWLLQYYGNVPRAESPWAAPSGSEPGWYTFDHRPRFNTNYVGLRNRLAILSEAYAYLTFEERIEVTHGFVVAILDYVRDNASAIRAAAATADARRLVGERLPLRGAFHRAAQPIEILMGEVARERNPFSGEVVLRRLDVARPQRMADFSTFRGEEMERVPAAYLVPAGLTAVLDKLASHGVRSHTLGAERVLEVEQFRIATSTQTAQPFQGHRERTLTGAYETSRRRFDAGTVVVPMDQPLARLAFYLLEPRSDDGLLNWNVLDAAIEGAEVYPVARVHGDPEIETEQSFAPDHAYHEVTVQASAHDACSGPTGVTVTGYVVSNQPDNADGNGDGNTTGDIRVTRPNGQVLLSSNANPEVPFQPGDRLEVRAERAGGNSARIYSIRLTARDPSGNESVSVTEVRVEHDQGLRD